MTRDDMILLALGVLVLARKRVEWGDGWQWPLASVNVRGRVYRPTITDGFTSRRGSDIHGGVDIAYARRSPSDLVDMFPVGTPNGGASWFAPPHVPVLAARAGKIWSVQKTARGWQYVVDHGKPYATMYTHLETPAHALHASGVNTLTGQPTYVKAGDILGVMGWDPLDNERVRHLHFAVWHAGAGDEAAIDPQDAMRTWPYASLITPVTGA